MQLIWYKSYIKDMALNFGIGYGLMLMMDVVLVGCLVHGIE
jgi:hypothetical protein